MRRLALLILLTAGCAAAPASSGNPRLDRFEAFIDTQQVRARFASGVRAVQAELRADGLRLQPPKRFAGRTIIAGTRGDPRVARGRYGGCNVEIFTQPGGLEFRALCFQQPRPTRVGELPRRTEWQDRYLVARILSRLDRGLGQKIWSLEPTGYRSHACAHAAPPRARSCVRRR